MAIPNPEELFIKLKDMGIIEIIKYLVVIKLPDYSQKGYEKIKKLVIEKFNESRYAFVPNKEEAKKLKAFGKTPEYKTIVNLIPSYKYIDTIRTGLLVKNYLDTNSKEDNERTREIKTQIGRRPNGKYLMTLVHLVSTPYFSVVTKNLFLSKAKGYSESNLLDEFDEIVSEFEDSYLPVKTNYSKKQIKDFCEKQVVARKRKFFLLGIMKAANNIESVIADLNKFFKANRYSSKVEKDDEGIEPRVEVTVKLKDILEETHK